jgi:hypothetical protein
MWFQVFLFNQGRLSLGEERRGVVDKIFRVKRLFFWILLFKEDSSYFEL